MNMAHIRNIDLNLLITLECLYRHLNVSSAANELGITQSGISHSLNRLREHYKDPMFVRISKGIAPTEFAKSIRYEVEEFVTRAHHLSEKIEIFNPKLASGRIVISTTEYFEILIGDKLYSRLLKEAPNVQISFRPTLGSLPKDQLEVGHCDIAIAGFYKNLPEGLYQQKLFSDSFSTAYKIGHPKFKKGLNQENFYQSKHALITLQGDFKDGFSKIIQGKRQVRSIQYGSASFTSLAWTISNSDLVLTAPTLLLKRYKEYFPIELKPCPIDTTPLSIQMIWHGLTHQNPLRKWVRQIIKEICAELT